MLLISASLKLPNDCTLDIFLTGSIQGRSHAFKSGGAQAAKIILGPFYLKNDV